MRRNIKMCLKSRVLRREMCCENEAGVQQQDAAAQQARGVRCRFYSDARKLRIASITFSGWSIIAKWRAGATDTTCTRGAPSSSAL